MIRRYTQAEAVAEKCRQCHVYNPEAEESYIIQVSGCTDTRCALWEWRPRTWEFQHDPDYDKDEIMKRWKNR